MPKKRKKSGSKQLEKRLFIICEGMKDKSESAYFKSLIDDCCFEGNKVEVSVKDTRKNTGKELVQVAKKTREFDFDEVWVVYDKDGYTKHAETFSLAKNSKIEIAFSAISFEIWILFHFEYTSRSFLKSEDVIHYMNKKGYLDYSKSSETIYEETKDKIGTALSNCLRIQKYQKTSNPRIFNIYEHDTYSNINELVDKIYSMQKDN